MMVLLFLLFLLLMKLWKNASRQIWILSTDVQRGHCLKIIPFFVKSDDDRQNWRKINRKLTKKSMKTNKEMTKFDTIWHKFTFLRQKFTCSWQNLTYSAAKISPMSSNIAVIANNLLKISKLSLLRTIRSKCNRSNICKSVEFVLFRYEWELSPTQAIHMILLLFCFVDFNCLAAAAALENYNPLKIVNGYHRIYT